MAKREKKVIITGVTRESADEAFGAYAKADAQSAKITADIELQCAKIREKYANKLAELEDEKDKAFATLQAYATENQAELFTKKKSLEMAHGGIGEQHHVCVVRAVVHCGVELHLVAVLEWVAHGRVFAHPFTKLNNG